MATIRQSQDIFDSKAVYADLIALSAVINSPEPSDAMRTLIMELLESHFSKGKQVIRTRFEQSSNGAAALAEYTYLVDQVLTVLFKFISQHLMPAAELKSHVSFIAVGGYGRKELFPYSDIDILFLYDTKHEQEAGIISQFVLYILWDLGLTVGQSVRDVDETINQAFNDFIIRTNLLDARLICGNKKRFKQLKERLRHDVMRGDILEFVEAKLTERNERHKRCGDSRFVLEPNIKEGKGGLRDLQLIGWLAKYTHNIDSIDDLVKQHLFTKEEKHTFRKAEKFFFMVRMHLHYLSSRPEERLTFDMQQQIATKLGFRGQNTNKAVERFMKRYFQVAKDVGTLTRVFCAILEEENKRKPRLISRLLEREETIDEFCISGHRLNLRKETRIQDNPLLIFKAFKLSHIHELDLHPHLLQRITRNLPLIDQEFQQSSDANELFMDIVLSQTNPVTTLRRMNEAGVLGKFITDFGRVVGQMQFDMYHVYTVDEHTIHALGILHDIFAGKYRQEFPLASDLVHQIKLRRSLFLSVICHDIAKGRGGDHSILGEKIAYKLADRFGLTAPEKETAGWLVRHHLAMCDTAFKRDINDHKTLEDFIALVQSPERLRLLLILTVVDIHAVGPGVWNGWKGSLLRELYFICEESMGAGDAQTPEAHKARLGEEMQQLLSDWKKEDINAYLELGFPKFWYMREATEHVRFAQMLTEAESAEFPLGFDARIDNFRSITELTICTINQHGLFSKISGALSLHGANIVNAKIFTLKNGIAIESFWIQDITGKAYDRADKLKKIEETLQLALSDQLDITAELDKKSTALTKRMKAFKTPSQVIIDNSASEEYTVIEVSGRDKLGFLYTITQALTSLGLSISTAHVSTYGERAVDVFYVKDVFGGKLTDQHKIMDIRLALSQVLTNKQDKKAA